MKRKDIIRFLIFRTLGNFFILFTIFGFFATFGPAIYYEIVYRLGSANGVKFVLAQNAKQSELGKIIPKNQYQNTENNGSSQSSESESLLGAVLSGQKEHILVPKSTDFAVVIPKIGANETISPNIDPSNEKEYLEALKKTVAHAKGTAFPGMDGNIYLFAHSADNFWNIGRYNAVFYLLKELGPGDDVVVFFQGKRFDYQVESTKIVDAEDVSHIQANLGGGEQLILQTCWPPGTTWKRLLVIAKPKMR